MKTFNLRVEDDDYEKLKKYFQNKQGISINKGINSILKMYIKGKGLKA